jgi:hypothetical protein
METNLHFERYLTQFFTELEMFQAKVLEKNKTRVLYSFFF